MKPKATFPPLGRIIPFQLLSELDAVTVAPLCWKLAFQPWLMR
jgi:hypothetical protein